jgi:hypothetical protein
MANRTLPPPDRTGAKDRQSEMVRQPWASDRQFRSVALRVPLAVAESMTGDPVCLGEHQDQRLALLALPQQRWPAPAATGRVPCSSHRLFTALPSDASCRVHPKWREQAGI